MCDALTLTKTTLNFTVYFTGSNVKFEPVKWHPWLLNKMILLYNSNAWHYYFLITRPAFDRSHVLEVRVEKLLDVFASTVFD
jgi:hypothetical protein